ncbi:hypothetical protein [Peribacillus sp. SCS-155]|uniref:hypothetical protein n=1 Tax=Peribacillus sedimenti TaxID=3115297 RepID=UPI00390587DE
MNKEILALFNEMALIMENIEDSMVEIVNQERCLLWSQQFQMVNRVQESFDKAEADWMIKDFEKHSFMLKDDTAQVPIPLNPKLGF